MRREPLLTADLLRTTMRSITVQTSKVGCDVLAVDGIADHIHALLKMPGTITVSDVARQLKGATSRMINLTDYGSNLSQAAFRWQHGFGAFTVSRSHLAKIIACVRNQEQHHASGSLFPSLEQTGDE
jgi:putative transposase